jgi:hypothetical protein
MNARKLLTWLSVPLLLFALFAGYRAAAQHRYQRTRQTWKTAALRELAELSITNQQVRTELEQIKHPTPSLDFGWAHEHVILMTNGDYLVYAFWHGFNNGAVDHLFLAHGTDGNWYYSTYHFCTRMAAIAADEPSGSIAEFAGRYSVREFDGHSDECLKHTWPQR